MVLRATRLGRVLTAFGLVFVLAGTAWAQQNPTPGDPLPLGDDDSFIFFVDGFNAQLSSIDGSIQIVEDPANPGSGDMVAQYNYAAWACRRVGMSLGVGSNLSQQQTEGHVLHFEIWSDTANAGSVRGGGVIPDVADKNRLQIRFEDSQGQVAGDYGFRLNWPVPDEISDGTWHEIELPLPPATFDELQQAKVDGALTGYDSLWVYEGSWVGGDIGGIGPGWDNLPADDPNWSEFDWDNVAGLLVCWDHPDDQPSPGGPVFLDDVYIAPAGVDVDLSVATEAPAALAGGVTGAEEIRNVEPSSPTPGAGEVMGTDVNGVLLEWSAQDGVGGYNVYASDEPFDAISEDHVLRIGRVGAGQDTEVFHRLPRAPHPNIDRLTVYYAVTTVSNFGVENTDISGSSLSVTASLDDGGFILGLRDDEVDTILEQLDGQMANSSGWPLDEMAPFLINSDRRGYTKRTDDCDFAPCDHDISATIYAGYTPLNELLFYAEVVDDTVSRAGQAVDGGGTWEYDSIEIGMGLYPVESILRGSSNTDAVTDSPPEKPDYQFRTAARVGGDGQILDHSTYEFHALAAEIPGSGTQTEPLTDGDGNVIGYKMLSFLVLSELAVTGDTPFQPPAPDEWMLVPFTFAVNDNDGAGRQHQLNYSTKFNVDGSWWRTPTQWPAVAMVGRDATVEAVPNEEIDVPEGYALDQNYPNPFNPATSIRFALGQPQDVTLTVYNMLGQRVATLIDRQKLTAGAHAVRFEGRDLPSGVYVYRIQAGDVFQQTRKMLLIK